jgi:hypothetical protein
MAFTRDQNWEKPSDGAANAGQSINDNSDKNELRTAAFTFGEAVDPGDYCYVVWATGKAWKAKADADTTKRAVGPALAAYDAEEEGHLVTSGRQACANWSFANNSPVYLSDATAGRVTQTAPAKAVLLGTPTAATEMICHHPIVLS